MNNKQRVLNFCNMIKNFVSTDDCVTATVLINEVINRICDVNCTEKPDAVYALLLQVLDKMNVQNPFKNKEQFYVIYKAASEIENFNMEEIIANMIPNKDSFILSKTSGDIYAERFEKGSKVVLIAEAEKFILCLRSIINENKDSKFILTTKNTKFESVLRSAFHMYENVEILLKDIYQYEFINERFDLIFAFPAFGGRPLVKEQHFISNEYDMVALENLSLHLNDGGQLIIILPAKLAFGSGKMSDLRKFIQATYTIKEIAELPARFINSIGTKIYLLDIENMRPGDDDIVIKRYIGQHDKKGLLSSIEVSDDTFVMLSELEEQGDWNIDKIFAKQDDDYQQYKDSITRKEKLGNVAQIFRGRTVNKKDPNGNIGVVNISNIGDYEIDYDSLDHLQEEERKVISYLLQDGDVLLPARGTAIRTAVFEKKPYSCIASSNIIVIRPQNGMLDGIYLKIFMDSPIGKKIISSAQQGINVMNISYKDLNEIEIPLPPIETQQEVSKEYRKELENYKNTVTTAKKRWTDVLNKLQKF